MSKRKSSAEDKLRKIPRPPNSFILYRIDRAKEYPKLVASTLSTNIALDWSEESLKVKKYYSDLAVEAKRKHLIDYPEYKFCPRKRGTGKQAQAKLKANNGTDMPLSRSHPRSPTRTRTRFTCSPEYRYLIEHESPPPSPPPLSRKQRRLTSSYDYLTKSPKTPDSDSATSSTPSLYHSSRSSSIQSHSEISPSEQEGGLGYSEPLLHQTDPGLDEEMEDGVDDDSDIDDDDEGDDEGEDEGEVKEIDSVQPSEQIENPKDDQTPFMSTGISPMLAIDPFEPECLARDDSEWKDTLSDHCSGMSPPALTSCSVSSSIESSLLGISIPSYEYFISSFHTSINSDLFLPVYLRPVFPNFLVPTKPRFATIRVNNHPKIRNHDLMMTSGLMMSTPSSQDALRWLGSAIGPDAF
ncbi:hypothetical protein BGZ49_010145 [Haplosporangium sp. Z 27]|nr:hypothetical protein BGZ49_010145 [Haplosporangium sp. Z 27]